MNIIYEDEDVLVVDKPAGMSVHPRAGESKAGTVAGELSTKITDTDKERPGIVHRLDKNTSGVLVVAKNKDARVMLQEQFKNRQVEKTYIALVEGRLKHSQAVLNWPVSRHSKNPLKRAVRAGGKPAITMYKAISEYPGHTLIEAYPKSGRTHQLRVHFAHLGHPVAGDKLYGAKSSILKRHFLHASSIKIKLPSGNIKTFESPLPSELLDYVKTITLQND